MLVIIIAASYAGYGGLTALYPVCGAMAALLTQGVLLLVVVNSCVRVCPHHLRTRRCSAYTPERPCWLSGTRGIHHRSIYLRLSEGNLLEDNTGGRGAGEEA